MFLVLPLQSVHLSDGSCFAWYCGLLIIAGLEFGHLNKFWLVDQGFCLGYLYVLVKACVGRRFSFLYGDFVSGIVKSVGCRTEAKSMLWKSLFCSISVAYLNIRLKSGFFSSALRFHLCIISIRVWIGSETFDITDISVCESVCRVSCLLALDEEGASQWCHCCTSHWRLQEKNHGVQPGEGKAPGRP